MLLDINRTITAYLSGLTPWRKVSIKAYVLFLLLWLYGYFILFGAKNICFWNINRDLSAILEMP